MVWYNTLTHDPKVTAMPWTRLLAALAATLLLIAGCGRDETAAPAVKVENALLGRVPSGTPYLTANLQPAPDEVVDRFLQRFEPILTTLQTELEGTRTRLEAEPSVSESNTALVRALLQEFDGKLNRAGLESLGIDLQAPHVLYGLGAFPVYRMGVADAGRLRATVQRILDRGGVQAPQHERQGRRYWKISAEGSDTGELGAALYVAILDDHLAFGLFPTHLEDEMLAHLLGQDDPGPTDAAARLQAINQRFGYTPYGSAVFDLELLADELMSGDSRAGRALAAAGIDAQASLDAQCRTEIRQIIGRAPRVYSGVTELTPDVVAYQVVIETDPALAKQMTALVSAVPGADATSMRVLEFAFGLNVGAVRDFVREKLAAIAASPYQCGHLQHLNAVAEQALARLSQPMPPLVNNFRGLRLSLDDLGGTPFNPGELEGVVAVHVDQPEMFVGMAQMFLPGLAELQLVKGGAPVPLPETVMPLPGAVAWAALSDDAIGLSLGAGEENRLQPLLDMPANATGTFLSANYDTALYLDYSNRLADTMTASTDDPDREHSAIREIARAAGEAYRAMAGRTDTRMGFTRDGVVAESRITFK